MTGDETVTFLPSPCLLTAHKKCWDKFKREFKKKYGIKITKDYIQSTLI